MKKNQIIRLSQISMLCAISILLAIFIQFPIIPIAPFLKYDMADIPILLCTYIFGTGAGVVTLFIASLVQAFLGGGDGWVGLIMHFVASGALVVLVGIFSHDKNQIKKTIYGMILGIIVMTTIMIPMNYIFTVGVFGIPKEVVSSLMIPAIIPFNLIKAGVNCIVATILIKCLKPFILKNKTLIGLN